MKNKKNIALIVGACVLIFIVIGVVSVTRKKEIKADKPSTVTETLAPTTTEVPEKTPKSTTTKAPEETPDLVTTEIPEETTEPTTTEVATETPKPTTTKVPTETPEPVTTEVTKETPKPTTTRTETKVSEPTTTKAQAEPKPIEKPITTEPTDNKEETPSYDSSVPTADKDHTGQVYDPVFGWVTVGDTIQDVVDSDGDIEKQIGTMGGN